MLIVSGQAQTIMTPCRILLAVESRRDAESSMPVTVILARALDASVEVIHVAGAEDAAIEQAIHGRGVSPGHAAMAEAMAMLKKQSIEAYSQVILDDTGLAAEIARIAENIEADLIVPGSRRLTRIGELVVGTVPLAWSI